MGLMDGFNDKDKKKSGGLLGGMLGGFDLSAMIPPEIKEKIPAVASDIKIMRERFEAMENKIDILIEKIEVITNGK